MHKELRDLLPVQDGWLVEVGIRENGDAKYFHRARSRVDVKFEVDVVKVPKTAIKDILKDHGIKSVDQWNAKEPGFNLREWFDDLAEKGRLRGTWIGEVTIQKDNLGSKLGQLRQVLDFTRRSEDEVAAFLVTPGVIQRLKTVGAVFVTFASASAQSLVVVDRVHTAQIISEKIQKVMIAIQTGNRRALKNATAELALAMDENDIKPPLISGASFENVGGDALYEQFRRMQDALRELEKMEKEHFSKKQEESEEDD